jgi:hypothetical protein
MNAWLSLRPDTRIAQRLRVALRRGTRMSHYLFSLVGCAAVLTALALWLLPSWRGTFAARIMPMVSAAVQAGPARLLAGQPLPPFAAGRRLELEVAQAKAAQSATTPTALAAATPPSLGAASTDDDSTRQLTGGISLAVSPNGLDPRTLPTVTARTRFRRNASSPMRAMIACSSRRVSRSSWRRSSRGGIAWRRTRSASSCARRSTPAAKSGWIRSCCFR